MKRIAIGPGRRLSLVGLALALLLGGLALAMTPAGTSITNQASASYIDSAGQSRITTSNQVVTVVQQVYSFTITPNGTELAPGQTKSALPGGQVLFNYLVQNTGNGTDTINLSTAQDTGDNFNLQNVRIYHDINCNGTLDAGEPQVASVTLGMGQQACVVVVATIPTSAQNGQYGNLNLEGQSTGNSAATDNNNWARATATTAAALTANKSATPTSVTPGGTITYTISGTNTGGSAASGVSVSGLTGTGILISDTIPTGLSVPAAPTGTAGAGTVQIVYSTNGGTSWSTTAPSFPFVGNGSNRVGMFISGSGAFFPPGAQYTFSFQATVPASAPAGTAYPNTATVQYNDGTANQTTTSNTTTNTVAASYSVAVGPYGYPQGGATGSYTVGGYTVNRSSDSQSIATAYSGSYVIFRHTLRNTGNTQDSFTLAQSGAPSGWTCQLLADDLTTPISGPVGPVAAGADYNFALKCQIPANYTGGPVTLTVTATSVGNPSQSDTTTDTVENVDPGYAVDLAAHGHAGDNDAGNDNPPAQSANPGQTVYFPLDVSNAGYNTDSYHLTASLPSGWSVLFYPDTDCDGAMDFPVPAPITHTGLINPNATRCYIAAVTVPAGAAPGSHNVRFTATSATLNTVSDTVATQVNVNLVAQVSLTPDRSGTTTSPGTIQYTHTLTNNSNSGATCSISGSGGSFGWTYQYSLDGSTWAPSLSGVAVAANGGSQTVYVRILTPAGQPIGRTDVNTLTATCTLVGTTATASASETTTVVGGELRLTKSAKTYKGSTSDERSPDGSQAYPGDVIEYTIVAENIGTGNLTQVVVSDPLPSYTSFVSVSASISGFSGTVLYSTNGSTWSATAPTALATGQSVYVAVDTNSDNTITSADTMPPGATITLSFRVQVQ